jgi:hypothetical protein
MDPAMNPLIPSENIHGLIYFIRGQKVMLDEDLSKLYGVPTKALNQAVRRNRRRFPEDFMFQLTGEELKILRSQFVTSRWGGRRYRPLAFTEQGVSMLSSVLNSEKAIGVNITIMRAFVRIRQMVSLNRALAKRLAAIERRLTGYGHDIRTIYRIIQLWPPRFEKGRNGHNGDN